MTAEKKQEPTSRGTIPAARSARKAWTPKSPVEVMLDQIAKQENKVTELQHELETERNTLTKLLKAKAVLESS
ncbi:MAG: hypothetical protein H0X25_17025 [Acidobacteriales bacterium]|nr:hypothetical protein [Terriglobales bacterium]